MIPAELLSVELAEAAQDLRSKDEPFAFATIVRTVGSTAAKPGAKALLNAEGTILHGWLGGGCTKGAVRRAAVAALQAGTPQLISVAPEELLAEKGVAAGEDFEGTTFARNGCPSKGTVDIFIDPCLPAPKLIILGASPVAVALGNLAPEFHWTSSAAIPVEQDASHLGQKVIVVATQGQGDLDALKAALATTATHIAFVGSARKFASLAQKLEDAGLERAQIDRIKAPAGLDIGAVTPEEIALSILAELVSVRRSGVKPHEA